MTRVRVRRDRPSALAWAIALAVTMLAVYFLTLDAARPDVVESVAAAPRVTREIAFEPIEGWCVSLASCKSDGEARIQAAGFTARGAAGVAMRADGAWRVLGAVYESEREARRIAQRLRKDEDIDAEVICLSADALTLRITAPQYQIDAVEAADALLREQTWQLGQIALQVDRGEIRPEAVRTLCALAATEAGEAAKALAAILGAEENALCAALMGRLSALSQMLDSIAVSRDVSGAALSGMVRCAQIETLAGQREMQAGLTKG